MFRTGKRLLLAGTALVPLGLIPAAGNPLGANVAGGSASVQGQGTGSVVVNQASDKAIINWNTFNIGAHEQTKFVQPSSSSVVLNRVTGGLGPSQIYGTLSANGQVFVTNPDGILIGPGAKIDAAGFLATTHDIANSDFMAGRYNFSIPGKPDASVVNQGAITAQSGGFAALVAPGVRNSGTITVRLGRVALASGNTFSLDFYGDNLITLGVGDSVAANVKDVATGQTLKSLVTNEGKLKADGGTVELTAVAARQVVDSVINTSGVIEANSVGSRDGMIVLGAATSANEPAGTPTQHVQVSGKISAAGKRKGTPGGKVQITGEDIALVGATINVSGRNGGTVLIGGDWSGGRPRAGLISNQSARLEAATVPTASAVSVDSASYINASAKDAGNGGKVVVWSNQATSFAGSISAKGGARAGDGGFVETSGHQQLAFSGAVDTSALRGKSGTLLLDPQNVTIGNIGSWIVTPAALQNALAAGNVLVTTGNGTGGGDITVNESISWASSYALTLSAYRDIVVDADVTNASGAAMNLRADNTGTGIGTVSFAPGIKLSTLGPVSIFYNPSVNPAGSGVNNSSYLNPVEDYSTNATGGGTLSAYMLVNTVYDLQNVQNNLNGYYALGRDIDASITSTWNAGAGFLPIGVRAESGIQKFTGVFNGDGQTISGLNVVTGSLAYAGLFGDIGVSGLVENVKLVNASVDQAEFNAAGGAALAGVLAALNEGTIFGSSSSGSVASGGNAWNSGGGLAGGLVGANEGVIFQSYSTASIINAGAAGGLVGSNDGSIVQSYATGDVHGSSLYGQAGGLAGNNTGTVSKSYASGSVYGFSVGGLVGENQGTISESYSVSSINFICGYCGAISPFGPLVGDNGVIFGQAGTVMSSYWNWDVYPYTYGAVAGSTGLTTSQLKLALPTGFEPTVWGLNSGINSGYPYLQWQTMSNSSNTPTLVQPYDGSVASVSMPAQRTTQADYNDPGKIAADNDLAAQFFNQIGRQIKPEMQIDWNIDSSTPITSIVPSSPEAIEAANTLLTYLAPCVSKSNCLKGLSAKTLETLVVATLEESGVEPKSSSEPQQYRIVVAGTEIALTLVAVGATVASAPAVAAAAGAVGLYFSITELVVRPIVGSG